MKAPGFWYPPEGAGVPLAARLLAPVSALWSLAGRLRFRGAPGYEGRAPLVCVGNAVAGGAGKTPTAIAIGRRLMERGLTVHFLSRGHGGSETGPLQVDPGAHTAAEVGDEPLLLAAYAPTWIAKDRVAGATAADAAGADVIVMDDGLQNHPSLRRDLAILVVDAAQGFGNGRVMPAGPLREPAAAALAKAHGIVLIGAGPVPPPLDVRDPRLMRARLAPLAQGMSLTGVPVLAFAGIGRPEKFFATLKAMGAQLVRTIPFPDHHAYSRLIVERLVREAHDLGAMPVTTEKDMVRIPAHLRGDVRIVTVELRFDSDDQIEALLDMLPARHRTGA